MAIGLAEYNAGRSRVLQWVDDQSLTDPAHFIGRIAFPSTQLYVRTIMQQQRYYANNGEF